MKLLDATIRKLVLARGAGMRWLREELDSREVHIPLTDGCLAEFIRDADQAVLQGGAAGSGSYVEQFRRQLALRARFIQRWTGSDEDMVLDNAESPQAHVRIARQYALPRRWKLSEPVVVEYRRLRPSYWNWTSELDPQALPQS